MPVGKDSGEGRVGLRRVSGTRWVAETHFTDYGLARVHAINLMRVARERGEPDRYSRLTIDACLLEGRNNVTSRIDLLKLALAFDENEVERQFPGRVGAGFTQSIKEFRTSSEVMRGADMSSFLVAEGSERGIDVTRLKDGYVRMKYVGGKGYESNATGALSIVEQFARALTLAYTEPRSYTPLEKREFARIVAESQTAAGRCRDYAAFKGSYPDLVLTSDLSEDAARGIFPRIREKLTALMDGCDVRPIEGKGRINYDPERGMLQLQECAVKVRKASYIDLHRCNIEGGRMHRCQLFESTCRDSLLDCCYTLETEVSGSTLVDCYLDDHSVVTESVLDGMLTAVRCGVARSVIRNGRIERGADVTESEIFDRVERP